VTCRFRILALALAALFLGASSASAATVLMCNPLLGEQAKLRQISTSGATYMLDGRGCAIVALNDVPYLLAQGFAQIGAQRSIAFNTGVLSGTTAVQILPWLPAGAFIQQIIVENTTANAVTGGIDIGTTAGGADVVSALTCGANCLTFVADAALLKRVFSKTAQQAIFVVGHTAGNNANLNVTIVYGFF